MKGNFRRSRAKEEGVGVEGSSGRTNSGLALVYSLSPGKLTH